MIVDLLRNDLSRVARPGSVEVPELFAVETYPTVLQMTSTVTAELEDGLGADRPHPGHLSLRLDHRRAQDPGDGDHRRARGGARAALYCGAIGRLAPDGEAAFNVAIRTLVAARRASSVARLGLGSGIVADSERRRRMARMPGEGSVCGDGRQLRPDRDDALRSARGRRRPRPPSRPDEGAAPRRSISRFDRHEARNELQAATFRAGPSTHPAAAVAQRRAGDRAAAAAERRPKSRSRWRSRRCRSRPTISGCATRPATAPSTTRRARRRARSRSSSAIAEGFLTEGSFTSLFVERGGTLLTPPLARGLLPGVLRARLIDEGRAEEADLTEADLAGGFLIGNAVRGLVRARLRSPGAEAAP